MTVKEDVSVLGELSDREAFPDSSLDTSRALVTVDPECTEEQTTSDKTGVWGLTVMGAGSAAVGIESGGIGGHCGSVTATWDRKCPDKEGLRDQEVLASKIYQAFSICCITAIGEMELRSTSLRIQLSRVATHSCKFLIYAR